MSNEGLTKRELMAAHVVSGVLAAGYGRSVSSLPNLSGQQIMNFDAGQVIQITQVVTDNLLAILEKTDPANQLKEGNP